MLVPLNYLSRPSSFFMILIFVHLNASNVEPHRTVPLELPTSFDFFFHYDTFQQSLFVPPSNHPVRLHGLLLSYCEYILGFFYSSLVVLFSLTFLFSSMHEVIYSTIIVIYRINYWMPAPRVSRFQ